MGGKPSRILSIYTKNIPKPLYAISPSLCRKWICLLKRSQTNEFEFFISITEWIKNYQSWYTLLLSLGNSLYLFEFNRYLGLWSEWLQMTSSNFYISEIFGFAVLKLLYCIILCQCHHPPLHILSFSWSRYLLVTLSKFGVGMLIKCCILLLRNI